MSKPITVFLPYGGQAHTQRTIDQLRQSPLVESICLLSTGATGAVPAGCRRLAVKSLYASRTMQAIAEKATTPYALLVLHDTTIEFGQFSLERLLGVAQSTGAGLVYSDYHDIQGGKRVSHPVIEYQAGSLRDDFNFGSVLFFDTKAFKAAAGAGDQVDLATALVRHHAGVLAACAAIQATAPGAASIPGQSSTTESKFWRNASSQLPA